MGFERNQTLGEVAEIVSGQSPAGSDLTESSVGVPFFQGSRDFGVRFPSERIFTTSPKKLAQSGDVLLSVRAPVGRVNRAHRDVAVGRGLFALRGKPGVLITDYLEYWLLAMSSRWGAHESAGAVFSNLSRSNLASVVIQLPGVEEQGAIAEVLGSLDARIEWAHAAGLRVLGCARALWSSASAAKSRGVTVDDIVIFHNRRRIPLSARERESRPGPYPYYGATGQFGTVDDYLFHGNFVLVGEDGSVVNPGGTPVVQYVSNRFWVNNHAHVLTSEELTPEELFLALERVNVSGYVTGAAQPKLSMGRLKQVPIALPLQESIEQARPTISALFESFRGLAGEVEVLRTTRDALLPKLVSGEIRIADPGRFLDEVA